MSDMICTCSPEGVREVETRRLRIFKRMGLSDMEDLTVAIVLSLAFDFGAEAWLSADMWFGASLKTPLIPDCMYIECDWPADGLATLWERLVELFPERATVREQSATEARITERISTALLTQYESAHATYEAHRAAAHNGPNDCPPCEDCSVYMTLYIIAKCALDNAWGARDMDPAISEAYA